MHNELILAVDGGATNCRAILCTSDGVVLGCAQSGPCNYQNVGLDMTVARLREVVINVVSGRTQQLKAAVFGLAGLDTREDYRIVSAAVNTMLSQLGISCENTIMDNDGMITLLGAVGPDNGVLVIAGTGTIACGITKQGDQARAGGWGHLLDDSGSGYAIGKAALSHIMRVYDGRDCESGIVKAVLDQLMLPEPESVVNWVYSENYSIDRVAALAPAICALAEQGDWKARAILADSTQGLKSIAMAVIHRLQLQHSPFQLLLSGGLLRNTQVFRDQLVDLIRAECPLVNLIDAQYPPICGAVLRALQNENIDRRQLLDRLNKQLIDVQ